MRNHISYSELKIWDECAYKHKLVYIDEEKKFLGNEYTAFGNAVHDTCEQLLQKKDMFTESKKFDAKHFFDHRFLHHLEELSIKNVSLDSNLLKSMRQSGAVLSPLVLPALKNYFGKFEIYDTEHQLYEKIDDEDLYFKGFIDAVIKTKDGKYHIIDWKTCGWGWDSRKKNDKIITYQLTLYKYFFAKVKNINPENIKTHFCLLKRTAKKNQIEIFEVPTGAKKTKNCLKLLNNSIYNIKNKRYIKNRLSCTQGFGCEFYKTKFCR